MSFTPCIYLIDDDAVSCFLVKNILIDTYPGCELTCFSNAPQALQALRKAKNNPAHFPALILLDLQMPEKDGWDFLEEYNSFYHHSFIKCEVVILTCSQYPADREKANKYTCVADYLLKPLTEEALRAKMDAIFSSKKYI